MLISLRTRIRPAILIAIFLASSTANAGWIGVELQGGQVKVTSSNRVEIDKKGSAYGGYFFYGDKAPRGTWSLGLGLQNAEVKGRASSRGIKQDFNILSPFVDARYLYDLSDLSDLSRGLSAGISVRNQFGKGAKYAVRDVDKWAYVFAAGAVVQYEINQSEYRPTVSVSYYTDVNNTERKVRTLLFGIGASIGPRSKEQPVVAEAKPAPVQETPAPTPITEPAPTAPVVVTLDAKAVTFDVNKSSLKKDSQQKLERLAKALVENDSIWKGLAISGHTDASGRKDKNLSLSKARAEAVCALFVKNGVKREKLSCGGYGSENLLPGLALNAAEHRRVELAFSGVTNDSAETLNKSISDALKN